VSWNPSATELTTAATDAALGLLCLALLWRLRVMSAPASFRKAIWSWVFALLAVGSGLGAIVHGIELPAAWRNLLWQPLYLSLGLAVALFVVGAVSDWRGDASARRVLPWGMAAGIAAFALTVGFGGFFAIFVAYEAAAMLAALAIYLRLGAKGLPGATRVSAGIFLTLIAAAVQLSRLRVHLLVPFDHNGLFHVVQMIATVTIASGVRRSLAAAASTPVVSARARP
jgi:hypothetical protein